MLRYVATFLYFIPKGFNLRLHFVLPKPLLYLHIDKSFSVMFAFVIVAVAVKTVVARSQVAEIYIPVAISNRFFVKSLC